MDTKLKKSKAFASFVSVILFFAILCGMGYVAVGVIVNYRDIRTQYYDLEQKDYQKTQKFRQVMSEYLEDMLNSVDKMELYENPQVYAEEKRKERNFDTIEEMLEYGGYQNLQDWLANEKPETKFENLNEVDTAKNVLYQAGTDASPRKYSNYEESNLYTGELPKGYNFRLIFDGKKVTAEKDGKPINLYGDGFYKTNSDMWYIPGYENLPYKVNDTYRVCIAARAVPAEPVNGRSQLYEITRSRGLYEKVEFAGAISLGALLFLLFPMIGWRKHRKEMLRRMGQSTGKILFELKMLFVLALLMIDAAVASGSLDLEAIVIFGIPSLAAWFVVLNDLRWNPSFWKNNIFAYFHRKALEEDRILPLQKRLTKRLNRFYKRAGITLVVGGGISILTGPGAILFAPVTAAVLYYFARDYKREYTAVTRDMSLIIHQIADVKEGNMVPPLMVPIDADMHGAAEDLNQIREGIDFAVEERLKSERMKIELITNVSHDIKTPLTSIISYVNLLKEEENLPDYVKDYIQILDQKSNRLKNMVQDIFEVSKAASGNMEMHMEPLDLSKLVRQTLADMAECIEQSSFLIKEEISCEPVFVLADGQRMYRVFQNLINNALLYSLEGSRIFVIVRKAGSKAEALIKNISRDELNNAGELTERFVRGDSSRTDSGSGLGLSIAKSFTEACGGDFSIEMDADLFVAHVEFPLVSAPVTVPEDETAEPSFEQEQVTKEQPVPESELEKQPAYPNEMELIDPARLHEDLSE